MHSPDILSIDPVPIPLARGVYSYPDPDTHTTIYIGVDSRGGLLNGELRRRLPEETEASVERELWLDLDKADAVTDPPTLSLFVDGEPR